jgi:hypothetical protein
MASRVPALLRDSHVQSHAAVHKNKLCDSRAARVARAIAGGWTRPLYDARGCPVSGFVLGPLTAQSRGCRIAQRYALLGKCTDDDVVTIRIPERKLSRPGGGVHVRVLIELRDKGASSLQCHVEIIDTEKQK